MSSSTADGTRYYVYDGDLVIGEVTVSGGEATPAVAYTWGANGLVSDRFLQGTPYSLWYHFGPQGETRCLTNMPIPPNQATVDSYLYTAYGEPVASSGTDRNPFRYGGQVGYYTGPGAGIVLCGARWYNPYTARWMTRDPIGYAGGADLYGYCGESPVGAADGLTDWETVDEVADWTLTGAGFLIGGIGGGISGASGGTLVLPFVGTISGAVSLGLAGAGAGALAGHELAVLITGVRQFGAEIAQSSSLGGGGCESGGGGDGGTPKPDRKKPILDQLKGSGQIRALLHGPGWEKGVNAQNLARHSMDDLLAMRKRGEISVRTYRRFEKYFEGRDLSHGPTRR